MTYLGGKFTIPDVIVDTVSADLGVPIIELEDIGLSKEKVISIAIAPAMQLYFSYYPIIMKAEYPLVSYVDIPFPDDDVFNVAMARVALLENTSSLTKNPFINQRIISRSTANYRSYGNTPYGRNPYTSTSLMISESAEGQSYINLTRAGNFNIDIEGRRLWGYSNVQGNLIVNWAKYSHDWGMVRFENENDVIEVSRMYALRFIGNIRDQMDANTGVTSTGDNLRSRADAIEQDIVKDKWKARIPMVVMH